MTNKRPLSILSRLPPGLSVTEVAKRIGVKWNRARRLIGLLDYDYLDGRQLSQHSRRKIWPEDLDPNLSPTEIARRCGCSKQRVSLLARQRGIRLKDRRGKRKTTHD